MRFFDLHFGRPCGGAAVGRQVGLRVEAVLSELDHQIGSVGGREGRREDSR